MEVIRSLQEAELNAVEFNGISKNDKTTIYERVSNFSHWYYFPDLEIFAPSKFIGYRDTTLKKYKGKGHGNVTVKVLNQWFRKLDKTDEEYKELKQKLIDYAKELGKIISNKTFNGSGGIYLPSEVNDFPYLGEEDTKGFVEGACEKIFVNKFERSKKARLKCISHYGYSCYVCDFNFAEVYGEKLGSNFIHVHHLKELSTIGHQYTVDPVKDLRPLCPNCHAMVHMRKPAISLFKLRKIMKKYGN